MFPLTKILRILGDFSRGCRIIQIQKLAVVFFLLGFFLIYQNCANPFRLKKSLQSESVRNIRTINKELNLSTNIRSKRSAEEWSQIGLTYSVVGTLFNPKRSLEDENYRISGLKAKNPNILTFVYGSDINLANNFLDVRTTNLINHQPREHADWFLKDSNGEWATDWEYTTAMVLDPGNTEWQEYASKAYQERILKYGYDGVFVDLVDMDTHYVNYKKTAKVINPKTVNENSTGMEYSDLEWKNSTLSFLKILRNHIGNKYIITNGSRGDKYFDKDFPYSDVFEVADGMMNEGFTGWALKPYVIDPSNYKGNFKIQWELDLKSLDDCTKKGKFYWAVANIAPLEEPQLDEDHEVLLSFITATFLLGTHGGKGFLLYKAHVLNEPDDFQHWLIPKVAYHSIGSPVGDYQVRADGLYERNFSEGYVVVNPTDKSITVNKEGLWKNEKDHFVSSPFLISPFSGIILKKYQ